MSPHTKTPDEKPVLEFRTARAFAAWLRRYHDKSTGIWLRLAKKSSGVVSVSYPEALEAALCYGWIDGQVRSDDEQYWQQKFTPRGRRSLWSKRNRTRALALIKNGRMQPAGLQEVERARKDGRWRAAYDSPRNMRAPDDFAAALQENGAAKAFFSTLNSQNRYAILFRITTAKKAETRARRIKNFIEMLARGEKLH